MSIIKSVFIRKRAEYKHVKEECERLLNMWKDSSLAL